MAAPALRDIDRAAPPGLVVQALQVAAAAVIADRAPDLDLVKNRVRSRACVRVLQR